MKSLEISQDFPDEQYPSRGLFIKQSVDSVFKAGIDIEMISPRAYVIPNKLFPNYKFSRLPKKIFDKYWIHYPRYIYWIPKRFLYRFTGPSYSYFIGKYLKKIDKPDIVHSHFCYPDGYGILKTVKKWKVPFIVHVRGGYRLATGKAYNSIKNKMLETLNYADKIIAVSHSVKAEYIKMGINKNKIVVIPNGTNLKKFKPMDKNIAREKLNIDTDKKIILFIGYLRFRKGVNYLIDAIPKIIKVHDAQFVIIGEGDMKKKLIQQAINLKVDKYIKFIEPRPHDEIPMWLNASDFLILPTLAEGRPNVVLESMACEKTIIASNVDGVPELINGGETGILIPPKDVNAISENIIKLLKDDDLVNKMGKNAKKRLLEMDLTWENYSKSVKDLYDEVCKN